MTHERSVVWAFHWADGAKWKGRAICITGWNEETEQPFPTLWITLLLLLFFFICLFHLRYHNYDLGFWGHENWSELALWYCLCSLWIFFSPFEFHFINWAKLCVMNGTVSREREDWVWVTGGEKRDVVWTPWQGVLAIFKFNVVISVSVDFAWVTISGLWYLDYDGCYCCYWYYWYYWYYWLGMLRFAEWVLGLNLVCMYASSWYVKDVYGKLYWLWFSGGVIGGERIDAECEGVYESFCYSQKHGAVCCRRERRLLMLL